MLNTYRNPPSRTSRGRIYNLYFIGLTETSWWFPNYAYRECQCTCRKVQAKKRCSAVLAQSGNNEQLCGSLRPPRYVVGRLVMASGQAYLT